MTRAEFDARYELIDQVADGRVTTHHALHQSGAVVMVHFLGGGADFQASVLDGVRRLGRGASEGKVLYLHEVEGQTVVVTRFLTDFVSLDQWFADQGIPLASGEGREGGGQAAVTRELGADPGSFADPVPPSEPAAPPPREPAPPPQSEPSPPPRAPDAPGEFTRMFSPLDEGGDPPPGQGAGPAPFPDTSPPPPDPQDAPPEPSGPGEFTKLFERPLDSASPPPAERVPPAPESPPPAPEPTPPRESSGPG